MQINDFNKIQDEIFMDIKIIRDKKGHDYAKSSDTLANFKTVSSICKELDIWPSLSDGDTCLFFIVVKLARLANLKNKDPQNEGVRDTVADLINYACLWLGCKQDKEIKGEDLPF